MHNVEACDLLTGETKKTVRFGNRSRRGRAARNRRGRAARVSDRGFFETCTHGTAPGGATTQRIDFIQTWERRLVLTTVTHRRNE